MYMRCTNEMQAYEIQVYEMQAYEMKVDEMHADEMHAYEMHAHEMHAHKMHAHRSDFSNNDLCEVPRTRIRLALNSHSNSLPRSIPTQHHGFLYPNWRQ
jgi:hypothetical protein